MTASPDRRHCGFNTDGGIHDLHAPSLGEFVQIRRHRAMAGPEVGAQLDLVQELHDGG